MSDHERIMNASLLEQIGKVEIKAPAASPREITR